MKVRKIKIYIPEFDRTISVNVADNKLVSEILTTLVSDEKLALPHVSNSGVKLEYGLWFGSENISNDEHTFAQSGIIDGDVLILKALLGKEEKRKVGVPWHQKITKQQVLIVTLLFISLIMTSLYVLNKMDIFESSILAKKGEIEKYQDTLAIFKSEKKTLLLKIDSITKQYSDLGKEHKALLERIKQPLIQNFTVTFYDDYNMYIGTNRVESANNRRINYLSAEFDILANPEAEEGYRDYFLIVKYNGEPVHESETNKFEAEGTQYYYTFSTTKYYEKSHTRVTIPKMKIPNTAYLFSGHVEVLLTNNNADILAQIDFKF